MKTTTSITVYLLFVFSSISLWAQQGIGTNTPNPNAALDIVSANKGVLIPRVSLTASNTLFPSVAATNDDTGILVFNQTDDTFFDPGFYFWNGNYWVALTTTLNNKDEQQLSAVWQAASETYLLQLINSASTTLNLSALEEVKSGATIGTMSPTATDGDLFWDTDDDELYAFDGNTWNLLHTQLPKLSFGPLATATVTQTTLLLEDSTNSLSLQASGALRFSQTDTNTLQLAVPEAVAQNLGFSSSNSSTASITISGGTAVSLQASGSIRFLNNNNALVIKSDFDEIKDNDGDTKIVVDNEGN